MIPEMKLLSVTARKPKVVQEHPETAKAHTQRSLTMLMANSGTHAVGAESSFFP